MNKREAKRWACRRAYELLCCDHNNEFLYPDTDDIDFDSVDSKRKQDAWAELVVELARRAGFDG